MTEQARIEEVSGKIAKEIYMGFVTPSYTIIPLSDMVNQILSLKDKDGKPMIGIISDDQSLPDKISDEISEIYDLWALRPNFANEQVVEKLNASNFRRVIISEE